MRKAFDKGRPGCWPGILRARESARVRRAAFRGLASLDATIRVTGSGAALATLHEVAPLLIGGVPTLEFVSSSILSGRSHREACQIRALMSEFGYDLFDRHGAASALGEYTFVVAHERRTGLERQRLLGV